MRIAIGSDQAGFAFKEQLKLFLIECGHVIEDLGPESEESIDDAAIVRGLAHGVAARQYDRGIVLGASGHRETIIANRTPRVRCTLCWNLSSARWARQHDNANLLALGCRFLDFEQVRALVECWLETAFQRKGHKRELRNIDHEFQQPVHPNNKAPLPHRTAFVEDAGYVCDACGHEYHFPLDVSAGCRQQVIEECPVCCHENVIDVDVNEDGTVRVSGDPDRTH